MLWTGFLLGLTGSWHCIGMCGPIALMIPGSKGKNRFVAIALYQYGKMLAYLSIASVFGLVPALVDSFVIQAGITLGVGILLLLIAFVPTITNKLEQKGFRFFNRYFNFKNRLVQALDKNKTPYAFYIGFLNGFMPCGLVYMAALGAMSQPDFLSSILFMLFFALGTLPLMSIFLIAAGYFSSFFQKNAARLRTAAFIAVGIFMIYRGATNLHKTITAPQAGESFTVCAVHEPSN